MAALIDNLELLGQAATTNACSRSAAWTADDLQEMIVEIRALDPKPGVGVGCQRCCRP